LTAVTDPMNREEFSTFVMTTLDEVVRFAEEKAGQKLRLPHPSAHFTEGWETQPTTFPPDYRQFSFGEIADYNHDPKTTWAFDGGVAVG
jgi:hypothetical protein